MDYDKNYYVFVLGYDLMQERLTKSNDIACDTSYERCTEIYQKFLESDYNNNVHFSDYENLQRFVNDNVFDFEVEEGKNAVT